MSSEYAKQMIYIQKNVNDLKLSHRREVLQMLVCAVDNDKLVDKGDGCQLIDTDIGEEAAAAIYRYINDKLKMSDI